MPTNAVQQQDYHFKNDCPHQDVPAGDFNTDDYLYLVVCNWDSNNTLILLGYGNGKFQAEDRYGVGNGATCVRTGDLNHDNKPDLIVTNRDCGDVSILMNSFH